MAVNRRERKKVVILSVRKCLFTGFWRKEGYGGRQEGYGAKI